MMATALNHDAIEEDSFIVLGTSPGSSLDMKCNGIVADGPLDKAQIEDAMKDLSAEASMAFKAHFKLGDCPSPASLMVASTIISEDKSTEELQKRFGEILDENVLLKETLKQNNDSMKEQFLLIASCQEDMLKTQSMHKEKFEETRELVERLRQENKKLKQDMACLAESGNLETGEKPPCRSGPPSSVEFVTSPDDDTVNKLTAQLELVERQRRQVIVDNEKLTWQKESLEHIVDATTKERDALKEKLKKAELQLSSKDSEYDVQIQKLKETIQYLQSRLLSSSSLTSLSTDEVRKRDSVIQQLEGKLSSLQCDYKASQLKVLELESVKMDFTKHKSSTSEIVKIYKDQIQDLHNRLKDAQITLFQPVRLSLTPDTETPVSTSEFSSYLANVKLYDRTLKHLAELLNNFAHGTSDSLVQTLGVVASLHEFKLDRGSIEQVKSGLADVKLQLEKQYSAALNTVGQVKSTLTIFEGIFKDYNELMKKSATAQSTPSTGANVEALTNALLARGQEVSSLTLELNKLREQHDDVEVLKAQLDLYKADFEAEREARQKMAADKENILTDLRVTERRNQELTTRLQQLESPTGPSAPNAGPRQPTSPRPTGPSQPTAQGNMTENKTPSTGANVEPLTNALLARGQEVSSLTLELNKLREQHDDVEVLKAQLDLYKADFEAEREARQKMAADKENILTDLRVTERRNQELTTRLQQLESPTGPSAPNAGPRQPTSPRPTGPSQPTAQGNMTENKVYKCPKCLRFTSNQYEAMEDHFDFCLDDF